MLFKRSSDKFLLHIHPCIYQGKSFCIPILDRIHQPDLAFTTSCCNFTVKFQARLFHCWTGCGPCSPANTSQTNRLSKLVWYFQLSLCRIHMAQTLLQFYFNFLLILKCIKKFSFLLLFIFLIKYFYFCFILKIDFI
jgi:hypothetical protein